MQGNKKALDSVIKSRKEAESRGVQRQEFTLTNSFVSSILAPALIRLTADVNGPNLPTRDTALNKICLEARIKAIFSMRTSYNLCSRELPELPSAMKNLQSSRDYHTDSLTLQGLLRFSVSTHVFDCV